MAGAAEKQTQAARRARICPRDIKPVSAWRTSKTIGRMRMTSGKLQVTLLINGRGVTAKANSSPDRDAREGIRSTIATHTRTASQTISPPHHAALHPAAAER